MNSRSQILKRIQKATGKSMHIPVCIEKAVQPEFEGDIVEVFIQKALSAAAQVHAIFTYEELAAWLAKKAEGLSQLPQLTFAPEFLNLAPACKLFEITPKVEQANSWALCRGIMGIAETGTIVSDSHECASGTLFLAERLIIVIHRKDIVAYQEDAWENLHRKYNGKLPRSINLITGPSRTADVEQTIQLGAHGPRWVDYLILD